MLSKPIGISLYLYDHGMVQQPVQQCRRDHIVTKYLAPFLEAPV